MPFVHILYCQHFSGFIIDNSEIVESGEVKEILGIDASMAIPVSAKAGIGIEDVLEAVVDFVPPPEDTSEKPLRALVFDSAYDQYLGTLCFFKVIDGNIKLGDKIKFMASDKEYEITELGYLNPNRVPVKELKTGDVGYMGCSIKEVTRFVGDTVTLVNNPSEEPFGNCIIIDGAEVYASEESLKADISAFLMVAVTTFPDAPLNRRFAPLFVAVPPRKLPPVILTVFFWPMRCARSVA